MTLVFLHMDSEAPCMPLQTWVHEARTPGFPPVSREDHDARNHICTTPARIASASEMLMPKSAKTLIPRNGGRRAFEGVVRQLRSEFAGRWPILACRVSEVWRAQSLRVCPGFGERTGFHCTSQVRSACLWVLTLPFIRAPCLYWAHLD